MNRVVITGLGTVNPTGNDIKTSWENTLNANVGIRAIEELEKKDLPVYIAGMVDESKIDYSKSMDTKDERRLSKFLKFSLKASHEALLDAGLLDIDEKTASEFGSCIGVGIGGLSVIEDNSLKLDKSGAKRVSPFFIPFAICNMAAGLTSRNFNLQGPNICPTTACSSGTHAVGESFRYIRDGYARKMLCGGSESVVGALGIGAFAAMKALCTNNSNPKEASKPFDLNRNGFVMGEGSGILVLENLEDALQRKAKIYAEVVGYGLSGDAHHITAPAPQGAGAQRCIRQSLRIAKLQPEQIDYINAHGTSTKLNDKYESMAIKSVFKEHAKKIAISSTKGVTGHCLGAAGGIEAVFLALALQNQIAPPTANLTTADPECDLDYVPLKARKLEMEYAMSNSFGFGGTNASIVFRKWLPSSV